MFVKSRKLQKLITLCSRGLTYQVKKANPVHSLCKKTIPLSIAFNSTHDYSASSARQPQQFNKYWIGSPPGDGVIKGKAAAIMQIDYIKNLVNGEDEVTIDDWNKLLDKIIQVENGCLNDGNIDGKILDICHQYNNLKMAKSYLTFMRQTGRKYNTATVCSFIKLCYDNKKSCTKEDFDRIEKFTNYLLARYKVLDCIVGESVIKGLCLKKDWKTCESIIKQMQEYITPSIATISAFATVLIESNEIEKAWMVMMESSGRNEILLDEFFISWIEKFKSDPNQIERLLTFFQLSSTMPRKIVCDKLSAVYSTFSPERRLTGTFVSMDNRGECSNCGGKLHPVNMTDEEFNLLRDEFLNRVLVKGDVFKNTSPEELKNFHKCVKRNAPFDIVIDGLNVIYMNGKMKSERFYSQLLTIVVRHFVERDMKVLVIGRKHMYNFSKQSLSYVRENSTLFLINDNSNDDPFMIYSTLYSGPLSCFVTRDLMRSEKYCLSSEKLSFLFKKWQQSHQIFINHVTNNTGRVFLRNPILFEMCAQPSKGGWHVPYHLDSYARTDDYGVHEHWLCLKK